MVSQRILVLFFYLTGHLHICIYIILWLLVGDVFGGWGGFFSVQTCMYLYLCVSFAFSLGSFSCLFILSYSNLFDFNLSYFILSLFHRYPFVIEMVERVWIQIGGEEELGGDTIIRTHCMGKKYIFKKEKRKEFGGARRGSAAPLVAFVKLFTQSPALH